MEKPFSFSVKALIVDDQQCCLVLKRSAASKNNACKWDLPGGKCDPGESLSEALRREVLEETGLHITLRRVVGAAQAELPQRIVAYLLLEATPTATAVKLSDEHDAFQWRPRAELPTLDVPEQFRRPLQRYAEDGL